MSEGQDPSVTECCFVSEGIAGRCVLRISITLNVFVFFCGKVDFIGHVIDDGFHGPVGLDVKGEYFQEVFSFGFKQGADVKILEAHIFR